MPFVEADGAGAPSLQQPGCSRPPKPPLKGGVQILCKPNANELAQFAEAQPRLSKVADTTEVPPLGG